MTIRKVSLVRFPAVGTRELFGRTIGVLRAQDGYKMSLHLESGLLLVTDARDGGEAAVHTSRVDACYLEPEDEKPEPQPEPKPAPQQQPQQRR